MGLVSWGTLPFSALLRSRRRPDRWPRRATWPQRSRALPADLVHVALRDPRSFREVRPCEPSLSSARRQILGPIAEIRSTKSCWPNHMLLTALLDREVHEEIASEASAKRRVRSLSADQPGIGSGSCRAHHFDLFICPSERASRTGRNGNDHDSPDPAHDRRFG